MNYSEKLKDPRWQRMRLEILNRDNFTCQICESTTKTLHVHHKYYISGREPWDYKPKSLITLCFECHEMEEESKAEQHFFLKTFLDAGFTSSELTGPFCYYMNKALAGIGRHDFGHLVYHMSMNYEFIETVRIVLKKEMERHKDEMSKVDIDNITDDATTKGWKPTGPDLLD